MQVLEGDHIQVPECLSQERVVILDVETTGFDRKKDRVIELGLLWIEESQLVMQVARTINPGRGIPEEITALTGITQEEVDQSPAFGNIAGFVVDMIEDPSVVVAYNSSFDLSFLRHEIGRVNLSAPKIGPILDPLKWVRHEDKGKKCSLGLAAKRRGISSKGAHRALVDCYMTLAIMNTLKMPETLGRALKAQRNGFRET